MGKPRDPRDVDVHEIVASIEELIELNNDVQGNPLPGCADAHSRAIWIINKLVGPERASEARWSSRHIVADRAYTDAVAESLAVSPEETHEWFIGEPIKRVEAVAAWALESADKNLAGLGKDYEPDPESSLGPRVHGRRGQMVADMLEDWAITNHTGIYRRAQEARQATPREEAV